jgi:hypothetical protein
LGGFRGRRRYLAKEAENFEALWMRSLILDTAGRYHPELSSTIEMRDQGIKEA